MLGWFAVPWELPCLPWEQAGRPSPPSHFIHWAVFRRRGREGETSSLCPGLETRAGPLPFHPRDACEVIPRPGRGPAAAPSRRLSLPVSAAPPSLWPGLTPSTPLCLARTENDFGVSGWRGETLLCLPLLRLVALGGSRSGPGGVPSSPACPPAGHGDLRGLPEPTPQQVVPSDTRKTLWHAQGLQSLGFVEAGALFLFLLISSAAVDKRQVPPRRESAAGRNARNASSRWGRADARINHSRLTAAHSSKELLFPSSWGHTNPSSHCWGRLGGFLLGHGVLWAAPALQGSPLGPGPSGHVVRWQQPGGTVPRAGDGRVGSCCHVTEGEGWLKLIEFAALLLFTTRLHPSEEPAGVSVD